MKVFIGFCCIAIFGMIADSDFKNVGHLILAVFVIALFGLISYLIVKEKRKDDDVYKKP